MHASNAERPRTIRVAAVTGELDWSLRQSCSGDNFDVAKAKAYVDAYSNAALARMTRAASEGAQVIVGQEYFRGSEMCLPHDISQRRLIVEPADGPTSQAMRNISSEFGVTLCCSYDVDHGSHIAQTGIITGPTGDLTAVHVKHPRRVPAPPDWPFNTAPRVYDVDVATVGVNVCSDATYDPTYPLRLAQHGMEMLLIPGCGFAGNMWLSFLTVRARDTQCPVIHADNSRAAIADATGAIIAQTDQRDFVLHAQVTLPARKSSPDEEA